MLAKKEGEIRMANQEQLDRLRKEGVQAWNKWRAENLGIQIDLSFADLIEANLSYADLDEARVGLTIFGNVDLRTVKGLETVDHHAPSTIGTDTLLRSAGDIPETFLRKAGLTDTFITYTRSLVQSAIEYYTCF